jgi:uncharacterized membrane protein
VNIAIAGTRRIRTDMLFVGLVLAILVVLFTAPPLYESPYTQTTLRARGLVVAVDNSLIQQFGIVRAGSQDLQVEVTTGDYAGQVVTAGNDLIGKMETDKMFQEGDEVYLVLTVSGDTIRQATAYDHYRLDSELLLFVLFAALLIVFAGWTGVRALLSFLFAIMMIWKVLLPTILTGYDPIWVSLAVVACLTAVTLTLVAGTNRTALVAILGAMLGLTLTCILAVVLLPPFHLHGAVQPYSETLLYTGYADLNLTHLFLAAVFVGASGAVMDLSIDVAAAMAEVAEKRPDLKFAEMVRSGFAVGRAMTGTMVTTLLMAYTAGYMALLMVFMAQGVPPLNILNTNYVAAEILKTLVGSFGLVTVAPFTALVGGALLTGRLGRPAAHVESATEPAAQSLP